VTLVFFLVHLIPGDPVELMLGETASRADLGSCAVDLGLDRLLGNSTHIPRRIGRGDPAARSSTSRFWR
jgi:peptide/nickel transport system permease protein